MKRILLIDDDPALREALSELLADAGYDVVQARNGLEALERANAHRPDLILLDLLMPVMNGWQFRTAQKEDAALADVPVFALTAERPGEILGDVAAVYSKPLDVMGLLEGIRNQVGR